MDRILLVGSGDFAAEVATALEPLEVELVSLDEPGEEEVEDALEAPAPSRVLVVSRDDAFALRWALFVRHHDPDVPLLVTIFDPTTAQQVDRLIEGCRVTSMADIVAPSLAGPCLGDDLIAVRADADGDGTSGDPIGLRETEDGVEEAPVEVPPRRRVRALTTAVLRPYDKSAALLLIGALGLAGVLLLETIGGVVVLGQGFIDAVYGAAKTLVSVDPNDKVADGPKGFKAFLTVSMLLTLFFEAAFTAGLVNRLIDRKLTGIVGKRTVPRRDHVVVVGLGQVGLRLCLLLRECGIGVTGVTDEAEESESVGLARDFGLPVVTGRGGDPSLLRRLSLEHAVALAAVTDDDLENVSVAMAALSVNPDLRIVLRAGDGHIANETRSLVRLGVVRDVHRIAAALIAAQATGSSARQVICKGDDAHLLHEDGRVEKAATAAAA